jgi:integration host factor subunit beta
MNATKFDLCSRVSKKVDRPVTELKPIFETFLDEILSIMAEGKRIELRGFGVFKPKDRRRRLGRNPRTGEQVDIPSYKAPTFKFSRDAQKTFEDKMGVEHPQSVKSEAPEKKESTPAYSEKQTPSKKPPAEKKKLSADNFSPVG